MLFNTEELGPNRKQGFPPEILADPPKFFGGRFPPPAPAFLYNQQGAKMRPANNAKISVRNFCGAYEQGQYTCVNTKQKRNV
jgi:hypothetical protein